ncbi:MAG: family acetyltransferase [Myxococcales bacterium]|nr:family acetyltransferase [Myxococcales bacterium]
MYDCAVTLQWDLRAFSELTTTELYGLLRLRQEVFVVEQNCPYLDADGLDDQATHLFALDGKVIVACARLFAPGVREEPAVIGRVVSAPAVRRTGAGRELMRRAIAALEAAHGAVPIRIGAQKYVEKFYTSFGFVRDGEDYLEDGITHLHMLRPEDRRQSRV